MGEILRGDLRSDGAGLNRAEVAALVILLSTSSTIKMQEFAIPKIGRNLIDLASKVMLLS